MRLAGSTWLRAIGSSAEDACLYCMTSHHSTETATPDATKRYPSDLNHREFDLVAPHGAQKAGSGKKRIVDIREVLHAIFYRTRTGCQWRMLPSDFPIW